MRGDADLRRAVARVCAAAVEVGAAGLARSRRRRRWRLERAGVHELGASRGEVAAAAEVLEQDRGGERLCLLVELEAGDPRARPPGISPAATSSIGAGMPWRCTYSPHCSVRTLTSARRATSRCVSSFSPTE
jgi:hypothetical protein